MRKWIAQRFSIQVRSLLQGGDEEYKGEQIASWRAAFWGSEFASISK
jgi:hypothetical protein